MSTTIMLNLTLNAKPLGNLRFKLSASDRNAIPFLQLAKSQKFRGARMCINSAGTYIVFDTTGNQSLDHFISYIDKNVTLSEGPGVLYALTMGREASASSAAAEISRLFVISLPIPGHLNGQVEVKPKADDSLEEEEVPIMGKKPKRPATKNRLQSSLPNPSINKVASNDTDKSFPTSSVGTFSYTSAAATNTSASGDGGPIGTTITNPHKLPMKYPIGDLSRIRPELRNKYVATDLIAALIPNGDRTATTRNPPPGVKVGHYNSFVGIEGVYIVTGFEKVDLSTPEGLERWSQREGWSTEAAFSFGSQVSTGKTQMLYKRANPNTPKISNASKQQQQHQQQETLFTPIGHLVEGHDLLRQIASLSQVSVPQGPSVPIILIEGCGEIHELE